MPPAIPAALAMAVSILVWALSFPLIKIALIEIDPIPLAAVRFAIAGMLSAIWLLWRRPQLPAGRDIPLFLICALIGIALYNIALNTGQQTVSVGAASFIVNTAPLITMILAGLFLDERFTIWGWIGTLVGLSGVAVIGAGEPGGLSFGAGTSVILIAALCTSIYFVLQKPMVGRYGALPCTAYILIAGTLWLGPWLPAGLMSAAASSAMTVLAVLSLGIVSATIGFATWTYALGYYGAARAANFIYLIPPIAILLAYLMTGEIPNAYTVSGGAIAIAGVVIVNTRGRRRASSQPKP